MSCRSRRVRVSKGLPEAAGTAGGSERVALCHARTCVAEERAILFSATPDLAQASTGWDKELLITVLYGSLRCQPGVLARPVRLDLWLSRRAKKPPLTCCNRNFVRQLQRSPVACFRAQHTVPRAACLSAGSRSQRSWAACIQLARHARSAGCTCVLGPGTGRHQR